MAIESLGIVYAVILLSKALSAAWVIGRVRSTLPVNLSDATILQPIMSGDSRLHETLAANLEALPTAQFFWLIDESDMAAKEAVAALRQRYPQRRIRKFCLPQAPEGVNPKTFKLEQAWGHIETPVCVVLDDDAQLSAATLASMIAALDDNVLATALPYYLDDERWPSRLLAQFVNNNSALAYLPLLPYAEPLSINGMCYALRTQYLLQLGGFSPILRHLTDDLAMADRVRSAGGRLQQLIAPVAMQTSVHDALRYARQMHRWFLFATLLMRRQSLGTNLAILLLQGVHPVILCSLVFFGFRELDLIASGSGDTESALTVLVGVLVLRLTCLATLQRWLTGAVRHRPVLSILSELLQPVHLVHALLVRTIWWRTRRYQVIDNDHFVPQ